MRYGFLLIGFVLLLNATRMSKAGERPARDDAPGIHAFSVGGIRIGSTLDDLNERLPTAVEKVSPFSIPEQLRHVVLQVRVNNGAVHTPTASFMIKDGVVASITIDYSSEAIAEIEKAGPILKQLTEQFGLPTREQKGDQSYRGMVSVWQFPDAERWMSHWKLDTGGACLFIRQWSGDEQVPKTSLLGFDELPRAHP